MEKIKTKILILGSTGMLGHVVFNYFDQQNKYDLYDLVFRNKLRNESIICDITNVIQLKDTISSIKPDLIINCIGILIKGSEVNPANAIFINSYFPHLLVGIADKIEAKIIHISTDCVFSGNKGSYTERDFCDADDIYGRSKALGEIFSDKHLTLRTSIIGPEIKTVGEGLFHWFMNQNGKINGFTNAYWGGVTTLQFAKSIELSLEQKLTGLHQVTNGERISKYELIKLFKDIWQRNLLTIIAYPGKAVDKSLVQSGTFDFNIPSYTEMLENQYDWMSAQQQIYNHYNTKLL